MTEVLLRARKVTRRFGGLVAVDGVSLELQRGTVHAVIGTNGAGKSTLINILSGELGASSGSVELRGTDITRWSQPRRARAGIGRSYQRTTIYPVFTVLENLMLGEGTGVRLDVEAGLRALERFATTLGLEVDPHALTSRLALGQQQQIEIIKALWSGSKVLILDEPTSMLTPQGIEELEKVVSQLRDEGLAIIFITHKLHEALDLGDRVSILRGGRVVGSWGPDVVKTTARADMQALIVGAMFGEDAGSVEGMAEIRDGVTGRAERRELPSEPVLELLKVSVEPLRGEVGAHDVELALRPGEILGVAGVDGNGQRELAEAVSGQRSLSGGDIRLDGVSIARASVNKRQALGLRYVTDDRIGEGTVGTLSVGLNLVLKRIGEEPFWRGGRIREEAIDAVACDLVEGFDIRTPGTETRCGTLSGGNLQKVVLARELSFHPKVVVYNKPTYGLDLKTTLAVRERIRDLAEQEGVAALLISTDLGEILDLSDRIAVLFRGRVMGIVE
ncbi:MAG: ATP-binding cassette domain-containing protein, partial [Rubrivivax sp.]|nr:ATP-binding cassette domain-containing protein [Rubrivivax sp.]